MSNNNTVELGYFWDKDPEAFRFKELFASCPLFDSAYEERFVSMIVHQYYYMEIGITPFGRWRDELHRILYINIPYWNKLYESINQDFNPLWTVDLTSDNETKHAGLSDTTTWSEAHSEADSFTKDKSGSLFSDTPQVQLQKRGDYARNITNSTTAVENKTGTDSDSDSGFHGQDTSLDSYISKTTGYSGINPAVQLAQYRQALINVDMMVLDELLVLFCLIVRSDINGI